MSILPDPRRRPDLDHMPILPDPRRRPNFDPDRPGLLWSLILILIIFLVSILVIKAIH